MQQRILIVDDEDDICMILSYSLTQAGYEVLTAHSAEEALPIVRSRKPDLILLDIMMDGMSGTQMVACMREQGLLTMPVIFLTALGDETSVLKGFSLGADDYIAKPFHIQEVLARVAAVLKRTAKPASAPEELTFEGLHLNLHDRSVTVDGTPVTLTRKEFELLYHLLSHQGKLFSRNDLLATVWADGGSYVLERTVDVHITHLRRKLGQYGAHIITKSGYGYMWNK